MRKGKSVSWGKGQRENRRGGAAVETTGPQIVTSKPLPYDTEVPYATTRSFEIKEL